MIRKGGISISSVESHLSLRIQQVSDSGTDAIAISYYELALLIFLIILRLALNNQRFSKLRMHIFLLVSLSDPHFS